MIKQRTYEYNGDTYVSTITFKRIRHIIIRFDLPSKKMRISCPYLTPLREIDAMVKKHLPKQIASYKPTEPPYSDGMVYFLGEKVEVGLKSNEEILSLLKEEGLPIIENRVRHFESAIGISKPYKVRVRPMKTRYGVNSRKTHSVTFQTQLLHFSLPIIDAVIVHELCHDAHFDHSKAFYKMVYDYCPDYDRLHRLLKKGIYHD